MPRDLDAYPLVELEPVFSLRGLIAWLETQPPETTYRWQSPSTCLLGQYFKSHGGHEVGGVVYAVNGRLFPIAETPLWDVSFCEPFTFGAALTRARVALSGLE